MQVVSNAVVQAMNPLKCLCIVLLSRSYDTVSIPNLDFGAQYRAYAFPCQRLVAALTDSPTHDSGFRRLATPFRAEDFHLQSLASLSRRTVSPIDVEYGDLGVSHIRSSPTTLIKPTGRYVNMAVELRNFFINASGQPSSSISRGFKTNYAVSV